MSLVWVGKVEFELPLEAAPLLTPFYTAHLKQMTMGRCGPASLDSPSEPLPPTLLFPQGSQVWVGLVEASGLMFPLGQSLEPATLRKQSTTRDLSCAAIRR